MFTDALFLPLDFHEDNGMQNAVCFYFMDLPITFHFCITPTAAA